MHDGRSLIQRIYDDHFEGADQAKALADQLKRLPFPSEDLKIICERADLQVKNAENWRDTINTFFHRLSGIPDIKNRKIYD
jgi:alpha-glucuronidase